MKIDYPVISPDEIRPGDRILTRWGMIDNSVTYREWTFEETDLTPPGDTGTIHYLIDRPKPVFPKDYGTIIIAKRVRGTSFPDGVVLARQRGGSSTYNYAGPMWKSLTQKIEGADNHPETQIHDWVLGKVVPAE